MAIALSFLTKNKRPRAEKPEDHQVLQSKTFNGDASDELWDTAFAELLHSINNKDAGGFKDAMGALVQDMMNDDDMKDQPGPGAGATDSAESDAVAEECMEALHSGDKQGFKDALQAMILTAMQDQPEDDDDNQDQPQDMGEET